MSTSPWLDKCGHNLAKPERDMPHMGCGFVHTLYFVEAVSPLHSGRGLKTRTTRYNDKRNVVVADSTLDRKCWTIGLTYLIHSGFVFVTSDCKQNSDWSCGLGLFDHSPHTTHFNPSVAVSLTGVGRTSCLQDLQRFDLELHCLRPLFNGPRKPCSWTTFGLTFPETFGFLCCESWAETLDLWAQSCHCCTIRTARVHFVHCLDEKNTWPNILFREPSRIQKPIWYDAPVGWHTTVSTVAICIIYGWSTWALVTSLSFACGNLLLGWCQCCWCNGLFSSCSYHFLP